MDASALKIVSWSSANESKGPPIRGTTLTWLVNGLTGQFRGAKSSTTDQIRVSRREGREKQLMFYLDHRGKAGTSHRRVAES